MQTTVSDWEWKIVWFRALLYTRARINLQQWTPLARESNKKDNRFQLQN